MAHLLARATQAADALAARQAKQAETARYHAQLASFPVTLGGPPPLAQVGPDGMIMGLFVAFCAILFAVWLGTAMHLFRYRRRQLESQQPLLQGAERFQTQMHRRRQQLNH
jgi:hypothetical protein